MVFEGSQRSISIPQAMRIACFTMEKSKNRVLQMRVRRNVTAKMLSAILIRNAPAVLRVSGTALRVTLELALKLVQNLHFDYSILKPLL